MSVSRALPTALTPDDELATLDAADIAWRIRRLRRDRGWTQFDLSIATGADLHTVVMWESEPRIPRLIFCCRLADAFECSLDYVVRGTS